MNFIIKKNGFSLVELLVTMSILGILLMAALPSFKSSSINNSLIAETNQVNSAFSFARNEAYRRNNYVSICASSDGSTCSGSNFNTGLIVFSNPGKAGLSNSNQILKIYDKWSGNDKGKITIADATSVFTFNGVPNPVASGSILICAPGYNSYTITLTAIGSIKKVANSGDGGC